MRAKATIDNVYTEMRNQGAEPEPERPLTHSRHASRTSIHYRNLSNSGTHYRSVSGQGPLSPGKGSNKPLPSDKKKNALVKESEYGVQGIKAPLIEVAVKAEEIWGPALGGREREGTLKSALSSVERCQEIFASGKAVSECIKRKDYENLVEEYSRARKYTYEARDISDTALRNQVPLSEPQVHQIVITGRMWLGVEEEIKNFKRGVWRKLTSAPQNMASLSGRNQREDHIALISILLELGVDDNPIWYWLLSRYDHLKSKINATFDRSRVEIEVLRRRLANAEKPSQRAIALHLKSSARQSPEDRLKHLDTAPVLELWELIYNSLNNILSVPGGLLGEVTDFGDKVKAFIDGKVQKTLPVGIDGQSRQHHRLSIDMERDIQNGVNELIDLLREHVFSFFADPPIEDISMLYSPLPPMSPITPKSAVFTPWAHQDSRFKFDANHPPPPSPKRGEPWEEFAFWPPYANCLSGVHYFSKILFLLGTAATEMANMDPSSSVGLLEKMRSLVGGARERAARAVCTAWNADAEACKFLEDWTHAADRRDMTKMPFHFTAFESAVLAGMQKILYMPDAVVSSSESADVVLPPPSKLLQVVRSQFVTSLYKALSGMVENAEKQKSVGDDVWAASTNGTTALHDGRGDRIDASSGVCFFACAYGVYTYCFIEYTHAAYIEQPQSITSNGSTPTHRAIRNQLLRQTHRRIQDHPRRPRPNRRPPIPILHHPHRRHPLLHHQRRRRLPNLAPQNHPANRSPPLHLRSPPPPRPRTHRSQHHRPPPNPPHPLPPPRKDLRRPPRRLQIAHPLHARGAHAGHPRRGIRGPDAEPVHDGRGERGAEPDLSGAGSRDGQRGAHGPAG